jgi:hypothetical protein
MQKSIKLLEDKVDETNKSKKGLSKKIGKATSSAGLA